MKGAIGLSMASFAWLEVNAVQTSQSLRASLQDQLSSLSICSSSVATAAYDAALPTIIEEFNTAWPSLATSSDIDPLTDVSIPDVDISCSYGGDEFCGLMLGSCAKSWIQMDWSYLDGLSDLEISEYSLGSVSTSASDCSSSSAPSGASCLYEATPTFLANLVSGAEVKIQLNNVKMKANCDTMAGKGKYTVVNVGTMTCTATNAEMDLDTTICGSNCNIFSAKVTKAKVKKISGITCKSSNYPSGIVTPIVEMLESTIYGVIESTTVSEINKEFATLIGSGAPTDSCS